MPTRRNFGRYVIIKELGRGGMAKVYHAHDPRFEREVALKVLPREFLHDPQFRTRFEREAKTIAALDHPAIVPVYDFGEEDGQPYLVMRYMTGGSLADWIKRGPLSVGETASILRRIGSALDHAHRKGVIHRDLKPDNILFDQYGEAFLGDFGIARLTETTSSLTAGRVIGTPAYMSPEQVQGNVKLDGRSDIYSLGIILFEMLTGQTPYESDTPMGLAMMHVMEPVPHIRQIRSDLPPGCEEIITRALAKKRDDRYATAAMLAAAVASLAGPTPGRKPVARHDLPPTVLEPARHTPTPATVLEPPAAYQPGRPSPPPRVVTPPPPTAGVVPEPSLRGRRRFTTCAWIVGILAAVSVLGGLFVCGGIYVTGLIASAAATATPSPTATPRPTATRPPPTSTPPPTATSPPTSPPPDTPTSRPGPTTAVRSGLPVSGPSSGSIEHRVDNLIEGVRADVDVRDFVVEAVFHNPYPTSRGGWDIGFLFRHADTNQQLRLAVESTGQWDLRNRHGDNDTSIDDGRVSSLDVSASGSNRLKLMAVGERGFFFINDVFAAELDLSSRSDSGDIWAATEIFTRNEIDNEVTDYDDFTVWSLSPDYGPDYGSLVHQVDGFIETQDAEVDLRDFVVEAVFINPYAISRGSWDIGFIFRNAGADDNFRLTVDSDGDWNFRDRQGGDSTTIDEGTVFNLDTRSSGTNRLILIAQGSRGYFIINGRLVAELDLSRRTASGDISVATGTFAGNEIEGEATGYEEFTIWPLP